MSIGWWYAKIAWPPDRLPLRRLWPRSIGIAPLPLNGQTPRQPSGVFIFVGSLGSLMKLSGLSLA